MRDAAFAGALRKRENAETGHDKTSVKRRRVNESLDDDDDGKLWVVSKKRGKKTKMVAKGSRTHGLMMKTTTTSNRKMALFTTELISPTKTTFMLLKEASISIRIPTWLHRGPMSQIYRLASRKDTAEQTGERKEKDAVGEPAEAAGEAVEGVAEGKVAKQLTLAKEQSGNAKDHAETAEDRAKNNRAKSELQEAKSLEAKHIGTHLERIRELGQFFALPPEVRDMIYEYTLIANCDLAIAAGAPRFHLNAPTHYLSTRAARPRPGGCFEPNLARVCKQINVEAGWWLWGKNTFEFVDLAAACSFLVRYASKAQEIRRVRIALELKYKRREETGIFGYLAFLTKLERLEIELVFWTHGRSRDPEDRWLTTDAD